MRFRRFIALALTCLGASVLAEIPRPDPLATPRTRLTPLCVLHVEVVSRGEMEEELSGPFQLDQAARLKLTMGGEPLGLLPLAGLTTEGASMAILDKVRSYFQEAPTVRVILQSIPRIHISVEGATLRSGPLTLAVGSRLSDALATTGYLPNADLKQIRISRTDNGAQVRLLANLAEPGLEADKADPVLRTGDRVTLGLLPTPPIQRFIAVLGEVKRPGSLPYRAGMTVRDAIEEAYGLISTANPERVTLRRVADNTVSLVDATKALRNIPTDNLPLKPDDTIFVPTKDSGLKFAIIGAVAAPATFEYRGKVTLSQAVKDAGGFRPDADRNAIVLVRRALSDPARAETISVSYEKILSGRQQEIDLEPGDLVQVPQRKRGGLPLQEIGSLLLKLLFF